MGQGTCKIKLHYHVITDGKWALELDLEVMKLFELITGLRYMGYLHWLLAALHSSAHAAYVRLRRSNFSAYSDLQPSAVNKHQIHYEKKRVMIEVF